MNETRRNERLTVWVEWIMRLRRYVLSISLVPGDKHFPHLPILAVRGLALEDVVYVKWLDFVLVSDLSKPTGRNNAADIILIKILMEAGRGSVMCWIAIVEMGG